MQELYVKLFFKGCLVPLPQLLCQGTAFHLTRKSMPENFPVYLRTYNDNHSSIFEELLQHGFMKKKTFT